VRVDSGFQPRVVSRSGRCDDTGFRFGWASIRRGQQPVTAKSRRAAQFSFMGRENRHGSGQGAGFPGASLRYESARNLTRPGAVSSKVERRINSPIWLVLGRGVHSVQGQHSIQLGGREPQLGGRESTEPGSIRQKNSSGPNPAILRRRHEGFVIAVCRCPIMPYRTCASGDRPGGLIDKIPHKAPL